ncbi:MAG: aminopeptidase [Bacillota bacterium]
MADPRVQKLAEILVDYSTGVKEGDVVLITSSEAAKPLVKEVFRRVLKKGAYPRFLARWEELNEIFLREASEKQLGTLLDVDFEQYKSASVAINIDAPGNLKYLSNVDPERIALRQKTTRPIMDYVISGAVRWVVVNYPTSALAQEAEMSLAEYEDFLFNATNIDWQQMSREQDRIKELFDKADEVRLVGKQTDLRLSVKGRMAIKCDGHENMPDGEIFLAPVEDSAEGHILYDFPAIYMGKEVDGVYLEFKAGKVVTARARKNEDLLIALLDSDDGARFIGELGIGTNWGITRFTKDLLFDEKIGGTVHIALGNAYPESGGTNRSAIHWDMIKDMRSDGEIYLDGRLVQKDGRFIF